MNVETKQFVSLLDFLLISLLLKLSIRLSSYTPKADSFSDAVVLRVDVYVYIVQDARAVYEMHTHILCPPLIR